ncbi:MAG: glycosyltransferase [Acidobacteriaceae bacterium]|nr:glycosyltransferase [Acidobacteriaceae bacterium]
MTQSRLDCVFLGLSITSTWGNGHATTYRGLLKELSKRGHRCTFFERDVPWYAQNRELDKLPYCRVALYDSFDELKERYARIIRSADIVVIGSYVPEGIEIGRWITATAPAATAFYDIDTPVTLANLKSGKCEYIARDLYSKYHLYFSFTGGPTLGYIERKLGSPCARALHCSVDPSLYYPEPQPPKWDIAYLGTYAADRQPALENLLLKIARQNRKRAFAVAGPQYPPDIHWPRNVERIEHLPASRHRQFYNAQKFALNLTRQDMIRAGYSPSVRLFEAAACGVPIITDVWPGLETIFKPSSEILPVPSGADVTSYLQMPDDQRLEVGDRARRRTLRFHTAAVRAEEFETHVFASLERLSYSNKRNRIALKQSPTPALI